MSGLCFSWEAHLKLAELYRSFELTEEPEREYHAGSGEPSYVPLNERGLLLLHQTQFEDAAKILTEARAATRECISGVS
jgi:hypothetical protein